jgi:DNA repair protein RAD5
VDHPLLVLGKGVNEEEAADKLLDAESGDETGSLKQMIALYAGGLGDGQKDATNPTESNYALQVLKELEEAEDTSECFICSSEIFDEVLLPCYHRGYVYGFLPTPGFDVKLKSVQVSRLYSELYRNM